MRLLMDQIFKRIRASKITDMASACRFPSFSLKSSRPATVTTRMVPTLKVG